MQRASAVVIQKSVHGRSCSEYREPRRREFRLKTGEATPGCGVSSKPKKQQLPPGGASPCFLQFQLYLWQDGWCRWRPRRIIFRLALTLITSASRKQTRIWQELEDVWATKRSLTSCLKEK